MSYGEPAGLLGINCGHSIRGVFDGMFINREKQYSEKENSEEYDKVVKQRALERDIRKQKATRNVLKAAGDTEGVKEYDRKIKTSTAKLERFCDENGLTVRRDRTEVYGYSDTGRKKAHTDFVETLDKSEESGIIGLGSGKMTIASPIETPIEQRHTGKGNPNAVLTFGIELNNRQKNILDRLPEVDSRIIVPKKSVNMSDLSAFTAKTGDEFALFTKGNERLIVRGNFNSVRIDIDQARQLAAQGYRWSGHTHPGDSYNCLTASPGDKGVLECFSQETSVIYNSKGQYLTFDKEG